MYSVCTGTEAPYGENGHARLLRLSWIWLELVKGLVPLLT